MPKKKVARKKEKKLVVRGRAYITSTFNNVIITFTDPQGNVLCWSTAGTAGFKGSRKGTPYAAQIAAEQGAKKAMDHGMRQVDIYLKGPGPGRETAIRSLQAAGLQVLSIRDVTPIPHDGCRPPAQRKI